MAGDAAAPKPAAAAGKPGVLKRRVIFGAILLAISCGLLHVDWRTGTSYGIAVMTAAAMVFGLRELHRMLETIGPVPHKLAAQGLGALVVAGQVAQHEGLWSFQAIPVPELAIGAFLLFFLAEQLLYEPSRERMLSIVLAVFAIVYVVYLGSYVLKVRYLDRPLAHLGAPGLGYAAILYLVLAAKGTDMFAFFSGRFLGRRKMIPWISPGKTWAGFVGGLLGAVGITIAFAVASDLGRVFGWATAIPFGIMIGLSSVVGDLVESLVKRSTAVKDSGGLVPEFGGVLDIIDCILFVAPALYFGVMILAR
jgi:phosphatidate cytidylyltransferase